MRKLNLTPDQRKERHKRQVREAQRRWRKRHKGKQITYNKKYRHTHKKHTDYIRARNISKHFVAKLAEPNDMKDLEKIWRKRNKN